MQTTLSEIEQFTERIAKTFNPERIILFGSYAAGTETADSDVDLLVVFRNGPTGPQRAAEILTRIYAPFPVDLLVRTEAELKQRLAINDFFIREVLDTGKVVYASSNG